MKTIDQSKRIEQTEEEKLLAELNTMEEQNKRVAEELRLARAEVAKLSGVENPEVPRTPDKKTTSETPETAPENPEATQPSEVEKAEKLKKLQEIIATTTKRLAEIDIELAEIRANKKDMHERDSGTTTSETSYKTKETEANIDEKISATETESEKIWEEIKNASKLFYDEALSKERADKVQELKNLRFWQIPKKRKLREEIATLNAMYDEKY